MPSKRILLISRHAPYGTSRAREALDVALVAATYDQDISLLFMDDGIFQLLKAQSPEDIHQKNHAANLSALPLYGIEKIYVHYESLEIRKITTNDLILDNLQLLNNQDVSRLIQEQDQLLSF
ncbi:sulfurtransferase complex subunit TusC [Cellvibrio japonicus]|uniref:DsrE/DsrF-like family n=1 Tax=Cellvibrio japonicus (strain Ueda107) TaxID=498211 RepID=B3PET9_CELJU|nr:sulfurtransferase complex subunit TusC [Cellvibrio japonicus]ACE82967.1 DsrE/DsrF-like family [Cellvibrio japonicus Ueda107]QEI12188.1 sulfurtransferase complex subunit TusC [Cellvibrio japonicus]QEI15762.1 sulfurtransferase complex subunit TusC [Cellvibrio japonicus]QEI19340.1 sulfurtransferase complex subunit TusC [Cellvibrio japonicus]